jgi:hypothetical protein
MGRLTPRDLALAREGEQERLLDAALQLMFAMPWPRMEDRDYLAPYDPPVYVNRARRKLRGLDRLSAGAIADRLVEASGELLGLSACAIWPWAARGEMSIGADEWGYEIAQELIGEGAVWLGQPARARRTLLREMRIGVEDLLRPAPVRRGSR